MIIREAKESDVLRILEIFNEVLITSTAVYAYEPASLDEQLEWYHHKIDEGFPVYVGVENERVIGYATYGPFRTRPAYKYTIEHSVYVDVHHRNKGYGKALLKFLIENANKSDYKTMVAGIDSANSASIKLHLECGFSYSGMIHNAGYKFKKWLDLAFYQLDLKGPDFPEEKYRRPI
jgi:phosphinothricin acetyltransferase